MHFQDLEALAAHLHELAIESNDSPRQNGSHGNHVSQVLNHSESDDDDDDEDDGKVTNDGTLLASDPPRPLIGV